MNFDKLKECLNVSCGDTLKINNKDNPLTENVSKLLTQCYDNEELTITVSDISINDNPQIISIKGTSEFLGANSDVFLDAWIDDKKDGSAQLLIEYQLSKMWTFSNSFPDMTKLDTDHILDRMQFIDRCSYIVTSLDKFENYKKTGVTLSKGINFLGKIKPNGVLCVLEHFLKQQKIETLTVSGKINKVPNVAVPIDPLNPQQYPWDRSDTIVPGIFLDVNLNIDLNIAKKIDFNTVILKIYMPTNHDWLNANKSYLPTFAYTGSVKLNTLNQKEIKYMVLFNPNGNNISLMMDFTGMSIANIVGDLADFTNSGQGLLSSLPSVLQDWCKKLGKLELVRVGLNIRAGEGGLVVDNTFITIGVPDLEWVIWDKPEFKINNVYVDLFVANPFSGDKASFNVCLRGEMSVEGVGFNVMANSFDGFTVTAELAESVDIDLLEFMKPYAPGITGLPDLKVNRFKIAVSPSNYYQVLAAMAEKDSPWTINVGSVKFTISDVLLDFKYVPSKGVVCRFSGKTFFGETSEFDVSYELGDKHVVDIKWVKLGELFPIYKFLEYVGVCDIPDVVRSRLGAIGSVEISYNIGDEEFSVHVNENAEFTIGPKKYNIVVPLITKEVSLSQLPVVGKILPQQNSLVLDELVLVASSTACKYKDVDIYSGAALYCTINKNPLVLQIYRKEKNLLTNNLDTELLLADNSEVESSKWININKSFGLFELHRFGISFNNNKIAFLIDASLSAKPIDLNLMGLGLGLDLTNPIDMSFYLSGLGVEFDNGALSISGAFLKSQDNGKAEYSGQIFIKIQNFSLLAIGSYGEDHLLVYAVLNAPIGGPPVFFVTGIAAGFGSNVDIKIPQIEDIAKFPLIGGAMGTLKKSEMLPELRKCIIKQKGQTFLAAGIKFTSFQMIESFALFTVTFGQYTAINVLGLSQVSIPPKLDAGKSPIAYAQLALKATFLPSQGVFSLAAQLTSESYILSKNCKLSGGFAFYVWFAGEHEGDFVLTLGGYNSNYSKPQHYPSVPRLGFAWNVNSHLNLNGELYFALTPRILMAGGRLSAMYEQGAIKAWFIAKFDLEIAWKPFHYDVSLFVGFGVSVRVDALFVHTTLKFELSAGLHIWGPEFSGTAQISLYITSFTIKFGAGASKKPDNLTWSDFKDSFLPKAKTPVQNQLTNSSESASPISITFSRGIFGEETINNVSYPIVHADSMELLVKSAIPSTKLNLNTAAIGLKLDAPAIGVLPMGEGTRLESALNVNLTKDDGKQIPVECKAIYENLPSAMWSSKKTEANLVSNVVTGLCIKPNVELPPSFPLNKYISLSDLCNEVKRVYSWCERWLPNYDDNPKSIDTFSDSVMSSNVVKARKTFLDTFKTSKFVFTEKIDLSNLKERAESMFSEEMLLGAIV